MFGSVVTRVTRPLAIQPRVVDLDSWRAHYKVRREQEFNEDGGHPVVERKAPAKVLQNTESSIENAVRDFCKMYGISQLNADESVRAAIKCFRSGRSGASAFAIGRDKAGELAWGNSPKGAA